MKLSLSISLLLSPLLIEIAHAAPTALNGTTTALTISDTATALTIPDTTTAPIVPDTTNTSTVPIITDEEPLDFAPVVDRGCSCYFWKVTNSDNKSAVKVKCDTIGAGLIIRAATSLGNTEWFYKPGGTYTTPWKANAGSSDPTFKLEFSWSGNADMGSCYTELIRREHWLKDYFSVKISCSALSPYIKAQGWLLRPGEIEVRTPWLTSVGDAFSEEWQSWWGSPSVKIEWSLRNP